MIPVIFVAPRLSDNASRMVEALGALPGVQLGVISADWVEHAAPSTRDVIVQHWRVEDVLDVAQLRYAVEQVAARIGGVERLFGAYEQLQVPLAAVREAMGIPGLPVEAALNFRDKSRMKDLLRAAHLPCARHATVENYVNAISFAERVGFPLVVKPLAGAGALSTYRVDDAQALSEALDMTHPSAGNPVLLEEFITGTEHSFETVSIDGVAVWHSLTHYHPTPLEVLRNPWIQWVVVLPRETNHPMFDDIKAAAVQALTALGQTTGSWRSRVMLEGGRYRFEGLARTKGVSATSDPQKGEGVGLRISGIQSPRGNKLAGDAPWTKLAFEFDVAAPGDEVDLVCELRAVKGQVWFDAASLQLVKVK